MSAPDKDGYATDDDMHDGKADQGHDDVSNPDGRGKGN